MIRHKILSWLVALALLAPNFALAQSSGIIGYSTQTPSQWFPGIVPFLSSSLFNQKINGTYSTGTGAISGTTLTITGTCTGEPFAVGQTITGATTALTAATTITGLGTGTGCAGTYTVNNSQTKSSQTVFGATYTSFSWPTATGSNYFLNSCLNVFLAQPTDPQVLVTVQGSWGNTPNPTVQIPVGATGWVCNSDAHLIVLNGSTLWDFEQFSRTSDTTATATSQASCDIYASNGYGTLSPFKGCGTTATGVSLLAGIVMRAEVNNTGVIAHKLSISLLSSLCQGPFNTIVTPPAIRGDCVQTGIKEGQTLAIPPGTAAPPGLSPAGLLMFNAMKTYGVIPVDNGGSTSLSIDSAWSFQDFFLLVNDANQIIPLLQQVN